MYNTNLLTRLNKKLISVGLLGTGMLDGKISEVIISVNTAIDMIKEKKTVKEIVDELMVDFQ